MNLRNMPWREPSFNEAPIHESGKWRRSGNLYRAIQSLQ